jgi:uncharacterized protein
MSALADRLRGVVGPARTRSLGEGQSGRSVGLPARERSASDVADVLGGAWDDPEARRFATIDRLYLPGHRHGFVAMADGLPPTGGWPRLNLLAGVPCGDRLLFVDLETTGLAGGAGTQAFLVGCAWFEGGTFRVRQFFLTSPSGERAMLTAVAAVADGSDVVVTFNGKSFDLPLIETRYLFQRMDTPFAGKAHVDMLHAARRLWRSDRPSGQAGRRETRSESGLSSGCRLSELEQTLCGHAREDDVPGFEIPARYFHYVRTGDARPLSGVLEHNRLDLISLALLTARAAQLLDAGPASAGSAREAFGLGRLYERGGLSTEARESFVRASGINVKAGHVDEARAVLGAEDAWKDVEWTRPEALRALAWLARRERRYEDAAAAWRTALDLPGCPEPIAREAAEALAVHHEHRLRDPHVARAFALRSLECRQSLTGRESIERRLARLGRKIECAPAAAGVLALPELA